MSIRFSIVVPVHNNPEDLRNCIESLKALDYPQDRYEIIVVDNNSTDDTAAVAKDMGVTCLSETRFQSSYAARNTGIGAAKGEFIAFTDSDCIADRNWLKAIDAVAGDEAAGCLAGEILSVPPTTTVERFSDKIGLLRQKGPLSGWHFKPYAQTANAVYRKAVFDRIGLFDPTTNSGGDAAIAWRMLDKTSFTIRFVPEAIVYHHHRTSVPDLYSQFRRFGETDMYWTLSQPGYEPPAIAALEADVIDLLARHLQDLQAAGSQEELLFSGLDVAARVARLSGYLQSLLRCVTEGEALEKAPDIARKRVPTCNLCGSRDFGPGPHGRLFDGKPILCLECGSLERHRMLYGLLTERWKRKDLSCLCVGEGLPAVAAGGFASLQKVNLVDLARDQVHRKYDVIVGVNLLERSPDYDLADLLEHLASALHEKSTLLLYEPVKRIHGMRLDAAIAELLPHIHVATTMLTDKVSGDTGAIVVLQPRTELHHA